MNRSETFILEVSVRLFCLDVGSAQCPISDKVIKKYKFIQTEDLIAANFSQSCISWIIVDHRELLYSLDHYDPCLQSP